MAKGVCIFCRNLIGLRKRSRLLLKHLIWVSGQWLTCPGTGGYATPVTEQPPAAAGGVPPEPPQ